MVSAVEPAETFVLSDLLSIFAERDKALVETVRESFPKASSPVYEAFTLAITSSTDPTALLGFDLSRRRALIRASATDVFIGKREQIIGGLGYVLPTTQGDEFRTTDAIYVRYAPEVPDTTTIVYVSVFVEKEAD